MSHTTVIIVSLIGLIILLKIMTAPLRLIWKLAINTLCGFAALILLNLICGAAEIFFGYNLLSILLLGFLGLPGIGLLLILQFAL